MEGLDFSALVNYGAMGTCLVYFMWKEVTITKDVRNMLGDLRELILIMKEGKCRADG